MTRRIPLFAILALCAFAALAGRYDTARKQVESSMLVTGSIDIAADGSVEGHKLDQQQALRRL